MNISIETRHTFLRPWLIWTAGFLAFPIAGVVGTAVAGRVDSPAAALIAGVATGAVLGAGQSLVSSHRLDPRRWIPATAAGMSLGEGLAALGEHPDAAGEVWHLPNDPNTQTTRQLVDLVYQQAGHPRAKLRAMPAPLLRVIALVNPTVRELVEMQYQFEEPFIVDSSKIATKLGVTATPVDQALADTLTEYE